ncbi:MAG TPA: GDP-mannose 4,6-dehydratase [Candidatus Paceibacterota bacterium]
MEDPKKVLITGITGFVGSHLAEYILEQFPNTKVLGLSRWWEPKDNIQQILDKITICYGDLVDLPSLQTLLQEHKPDIIFHLAAQSYVDFSFVAPITTLDTNVIGTANLLEAVRKLKASSGYDPIIQIASSSECYGQVKEDEVPIKETNPFRPASPYAVSKVAEDMLALQYWLSWQVKTIRTRMFTHTGKRRGEVFAESSFAKQIAAIEAGKQEPVINVGNLDSVRTFLDIGDACRAYWLLIIKCTPGEVYNVGGKETMTVGDMLQKLIKLSTVPNIEVKIDPARLRPSDVTLQIPSTEKFKKETGWEPEVPFDQTLLNLLNYWREYYKDNG